MLTQSGEKQIQAEPLESSSPGSERPLQGVLAGQP